MFGLFKRKKRIIVAPVDGKVVEITEVDDEVFANKMVGDGVAIIPTGDTFCAPIAGVVSKIFATNHAFSIKSDKDLEVMVHIGLETVALGGEGFERLVEEGALVEIGRPIIRVDLPYITQHAKSTITPLIVTDGSDVKSIEKRLTIVKQGDVVMEVQ